MTADDPGNPPHLTGSLKELPEQECWELLTTTTVGRVAFVDEDGQQLIPLNFAVVDGVVYFRTAPDSVLAGMADGMADVAFGVDYHAELYRDGWNVTVRGSTAAVEDQATAERLSAYEQVRPWAPGDRSLLVRLDSRSIAGRRVRAR